MELDKLDNLSILQAMGYRLKRARLNKNIGQAALAQKTGLSIKTVQNAENGKNPSLETIVRILRGLGLLHTFESFLPEPEVSPLQLMQLQGKLRERASQIRRGLAPKDKTNTGDLQSSSS